MIAPHLLKHQAIPKLDGILMFPAMLLGPPVVSIVLTRALDGRSGLHDLFARMLHIRIAARWWCALLIPAALWGVALAVYASRPRRPAA